MHAAVPTDDELLPRKAHSLHVYSCSGRKHAHTTSGSFRPGSLFFSYNLKHCEMHNAVISSNSVIPSETVRTCWLGAETFSKSRSNVQPYYCRKSSPFRYFGKNFSSFLVSDMFSVAIYFFADLFSLLSGQPIPSPPFPSALCSRTARRAFWYVLSCVVGVWLVKWLQTIEGVGMVWIFLSAVRRD